MITTILCDFSHTLFFPQLGRKKINQELIQLVAAHADSVKSYVFSASSPVLLNQMRSRLIPPFIDLFSSKDIGPKYQPKSYLKLAEKLSANPEEMLFIDDSENKLDAATAVGLKTVLFVSNDLSLPQIERALVTNQKSAR